MARSDARYREAYNLILDYCATLPDGAPMPAESALAEMGGVSRTVVRRCLGGLQNAGVISWDGREKHLLRKPQAGDRMDLATTHAGSAELEQRFLEWILRFDVPADTPLSVAELSRSFEVPQHEFKEFLAGLSRFGLVARRRQGGWVLRGFTTDFAIELSDFRLSLELGAIDRVIEAPVDHPVWDRLAAVRDAHVSLSKRIARDYHEFSKLDEVFHVTLNSAVKNRFVAEFQKVISLIFHYHYMWDKTHEKDRNAAAIDEHLVIIDALQNRDAAASREAARRHLKTSKTTLLSSLRRHQLG